MKKINNNDQNVISSKVGQDTSACQILGHSSHVFKRKSSETTNFTLTKAKLQIEIFFYSKFWNLSKNSTRDTPYAVVWYDE